MVNFGLNSASILGIFLAVAGASLYFLRSVRPELSRDHDIFFAAVGLLCGFILLFQGWRLDPILQFGQFLLTGTTIFFAVESIRLRGVATEQARRNTKIVDDDRPVSRVYRASLDEIEPYEEEPRYDNPRLRGYPDPRASRGDDYEAETPRSRSRPSRPPETPSRRRRPSSSAPSNSRYDRYENYDEWDEQSSARPETPPPVVNRPRGSRPRPPEDPTVASETPVRPPRRRPSAPDLGKESSRRTDEIPADYVDYQPIDPPAFEDEDEDLSGSEY